MGERRFHTPIAVLDLWMVLNDASPTFLVGGAVRDELAGRKPKDYDLATALLPQDVRRICEGAGYRVIPTGEKFGTMTVLATDELPVEVTTFRRDGRYTDMRHPDTVTYAQTIEEDLSRRDFTMNAMAIAYDGSLIDPYGGIADLRSGFLRTVGDPAERFAEDPLRMWRAVRFIAEGKAERIHEGTLAAIYRYKALTAFLSRERVRDELSRTLLGRFQHGLILAADTGLLAMAIPEWQATVGFKQRNSHHAWTVDEHVLAVVAWAYPNTIEMKLAALLHDIAKPICFVQEPGHNAHFYDHAFVGAQMAGEILDRLRYPKHVAQRVTTLIEHHMFPFWQAGVGGYRRMIAKVGSEVLEQLILLHEADFQGSKPQHVGYRVRPEIRARIALATEEVQRVEKLAIGGRDVMALLGIGPGPQVGRALKACQEAVLEDPEANTREVLEKIVLEVGQSA